MKEEGKWKQIQGKKGEKTPKEALKILLPLSAFNHPRVNGVYDRSGIFLSSTLKYYDLYKFCPSATVSPCGRFNDAVGKIPRLAVEQLRHWILVLPFFKTDGRVLLNTPEPD